MLHLSTRKKKRIYKLFLYAVLAVIILPFASIYFDLTVYGYKDFIPTNSNKPKIFQDSIKPDLVTYTSKSNYDNDSLFYFKYKDKYWILCWSTNHYQQTSIQNIVFLKNKTLKTKDLKSYTTYSPGGDCPISSNVCLRITDKENIVVVINGGKIAQKVISRKSIFYNLTCSTIGISSLTGYSDFKIGLSESFFSGNLVILKPLKRIYVVCMVPIIAENLKINDLATLLNMNY